MYAHPTRLWYARCPTQAFLACLGDSRELPVRASALRKTLVLFPHQAPSRGGRFEKFKEAWDLLAG